MQNKLVSKVQPIFTDCIGRKAPTVIEEDNVLVFGHNREWNQAAAHLVKEAFDELDKKSEIITIDHFFSMEIEERKDSNIFYIIVCNDIHISPQKPEILRNFTSTQIIFKLHGVGWKTSRGEVLIQNTAKLILDALGINQKNPISIGLLASLDIREFCVCQSSVIIKRILL